MGSVSLGQHLEGIERTYKKNSGLEDDCAKKMTVLSNVLAFALFIISCLGMAGVIKGPTMSWATVGIGISAMFLHFAGGNFQDRKTDLISWTTFASALIVIGALGGSHALSGQQVGYGAFTILATSFIFYVVILRAKAAKEYFEKQNHSHKA